MLRAYFLLCNQESLLGVLQAHMGCSGSNQVGHIYGQHSAYKANFKISMLANLFYIKRTVSTSSISAILSTNIEFNIFSICHFQICFTTTTLNYGLLSIFQRKISWSYQSKVRKLYYILLPPTILFWIWLLFSDTGMVWQQNISHLANDCFHILLLLHLRSKNSSCPNQLGLPRHKEQIIRRRNKSSDTPPPHKLSLNLCFLPEEPSETLLLKISAIWNQTVIK